MKKNILFEVLIVMISLFGCKNNVINGQKYSDSEKYFVGSKTYDEEISNLEVNWYIGSVEIVVGEKVEVEENSSNLPSEKQVHSYVERGTLKVEFWKSGLKSTVDSNEKQVKITIPRGTNINISSISANVISDSIDCEEMLVTSVSGGININFLKAKEVKITSTSGSIKIDNTNVLEKVDIGTVSGTVIATEISSKELDVSSTSGKIEIEKINSDEVEIETVSGKIDVLDLDCKTAEISSTSGYIKLSPKNFEDISIEGVSSDITIYIESDLSTTISFKTTSGEFNVLNSNIQFRIDGKKYIIGNGENRIDIHTTSGDIILK